MLIGALILALLVPAQDGTRDTAQKQDARDYKRGYPGPPSGSGKPSREPRKRPAIPHETISIPDGWVAARFRPEESIYFNEGRWTAYTDGVYLDPRDDTIYVIATWQGETLRAEDPEHLSSFIAAAFGKYREYANLICPTTNQERLGDPDFRKKFESQYQVAQSSQKALLRRTLTLEQYLDMAPNCVVGGNLWRTTTRFAEVDPGKGGIRRLMVKFPNDTVIQPFLNSDGREDYLPLLKAYLRREDKLIESPLEPREK